MSFKPTSVPTKRLSASITSTQTTFKLDDIIGWGGANLVAGDFGTQAYGVFRNGRRDLIEIFEFDPSTIASSSITIVRRGLSFSGDRTTEISGNKLEWTAGDTFVDLGTDTPQLWQWLQDEIDGLGGAGLGDVVGPASAVDGTPTVFDSTTGKLIKNITYAAFKTLLVLVKGDVGLGNVDNTSDTNKPVSTAQQTALDLKENLFTAGNALTKTGNTLDVAVDNTGIEVSSDALRLKDAGVTLAKMANLAQDQVIMRTTASTGVPETATITAAARTVLDDTTVAAMRATLGLAIGTDVLAFSTYDDATAAEVNTGTSTAKYVSPDALAGSNFGIRYVQCVLNGTTALTTSEKVYFRIPVGLNGMNLVSVTGTVGTGAAGSSSSGTPTFTVKNVTDNNQMLSTSLTIDASEYTSATAAVAAVINASFDDVVTDDLIEVAVTTAGTGVTYATITLGFQLP